MTERKIQTLIYSRVSGYYNPITAFNKGKKEEYSERKFINVCKALQMNKGDVANSGQ